MREVCETSFFSPLKKALKSAKKTKFLFFNKKVRVRSKNIANFLDSSLVNHVTKLRLNGIKKNVLISLSNSSNISTLKKLDLSNNRLDSECIEYLMKCNMPNLTKLNLSYTEISEKDAIDLFNSNFMSNIKKLDLSFAIKNFTNSFYESFAESKYLNQITHLKIEEGKIKSPGDLLLKNKFNLEYLQLANYDLSYCPNLLINGNYKNLKYLDISCCNIKNQEFVNLLVSPNLPNLENVKVYYLNEDDKTVFPPNSQSSITELELIDFKAEKFASLFNHCPKLKRLDVSSSRKVDKEFLQMMKSPSLSNLEHLHISQIEIVEEIFRNPIYSNLKVLDLSRCELNSDYVKMRDLKFFTNCTNLVNLTTLDMSSVYVDDDRSLAVINIEACSNALKNNPTFSNLKHIKLPFCRELPECKSDDDNTVQLR